MTVRPSTFTDANGATVHDGSEAEVLEYQARERAHAERLKNNWYYRLDAEVMKPTEVIASVEDESEHYAEHTPTTHPIEVAEVEAIPVEGGWLFDGDAVLGLCNVFEWEGDKRVYIEVVAGATPLAVLHEMAHALDIDDGHGPKWAAHHEALIAERYPPEERPEVACYNCALQLRTPRPWHSDGTRNQADSHHWERGGKYDAPRHKQDTHALRTTNLTEGSSTAHEGTPKEAPGTLRGEAQARPQPSIALRSPVPFSNC